MSAVSLKRQQYGELIAPETIEGVVRAIAENFNPQKIILFGSYSGGSPTPDSDLDLLVVMNSDQPRRIKRSVPMHLMFNPTPCPIDILVYTPEEVAHWNGTVNHIVTEAMTTGKVMYEHI
jgi:uncharacterized protein